MKRQNETSHTPAKCRERTRNTRHGPRTSGWCCYGCGARCTTLPALLWGLRRGALTSSTFGNASSTSSASSPSFPVNTRGFRPARSSGCRTRRCAGSAWWTASTGGSSSRSTDRSPGTAWRRHAPGPAPRETRATLGREGTREVAVARPVPAFASSVSYLGSKGAPVASMRWIRSFATIASTHIPLDDYATKRLVC